MTFSVSKFSFGHQSMEKADATTSKSSSSPTPRSSSFGSSTSSSSSLSLTSMKNAGRAKFKQMFGSSTASSSSSSPLSEEALNKMQMVKNEQGHYKNIVKGLKSDTHKMIPAVVTQDRVDGILAILAEGGEKGLKALKAEATGNGKLRAITTNLQNLTAMEDYAQKSGQPLSPKRQAFIEEAKSLLSAPVSNGSKDIPFAQWATRGNYEHGDLQTGWSPNAQAHMRDHLEKVQDFAARYQAAYESPFSMSRLQARSGASLKKMQQSMRQFSTPSSNSNDLGFAAPMRRESAPARMESTQTSQPRNSLEFADISTFSPSRERLDGGYGEVSAFSPFSSGAPGLRERRDSAPSRMGINAEASQSKDSLRYEEISTYSPSQERLDGGYGEVSAFSPFPAHSPNVAGSAGYNNPSAINQWRQDVYAQSQPQPSHTAPAAAPVTNSPWSNVPSTGAYHYFHAKVSHLLDEIQKNPGLNHGDAYLALESEFEESENSLHAHEREALNKTFAWMNQNLLK